MYKIHGNTPISVTRKSIANYKKIIIMTFIIKHTIFKSHLAFDSSPPSLPSYQCIHQNYLNQRKAYSLGIPVALIQKLLEKIRIVSSFLDTKSCKERLACRHCCIWAQKVSTETTALIHSIAHLLKHQIGQVPENFVN